MSTVFKKIIDKEIPANIVYEDDEFLAFHDINPAAKVHVLVIPKKEIKSLDAATEEDALLLGKLQLTVAKVARILGIDKDGYRVITNIGENGGILSGGQRQRISIARAFLKDAPILILDEMTSNVDPVNESLIQDAITELAKNRTVLVVAHHLKTIQKADQILVFQKGNLLEKGKYGELLEKDGYYTKLWKAQYEV